MATRAQRKAKHARRVAHALGYDRRSPNGSRPRGVVLDEAKEYTAGVDISSKGDTTVVLMEKDTGRLHVLSDVPTRAKCPTCRFSHKVRRDGTMSRHDVFHGDVPTQCDGTGRRWDSA